VLEAVIDNMKGLRLVSIILCAIIIILTLLVAIAFKWSFLPYNPYIGYKYEICYSPNHEYYIKKYQTVAESIRDHDLNAEGTVIVYDKTGRELHRGKSNLSEMYGPVWSSNSNGEIYMLGIGDFVVKLPSLPVNKPDDHSADGCY